MNLGLEGLDLGPRLADRLGVDVRIENDVKAAALGAHHLLGVGDGIVGPTRRGAHSMAYLNLGTGLAAGIVLDGDLLRGARGVAGEIGHIPVDPEGELCGCGQRGCLETLASGSAIARMWPSDDALPARELFAAAAAGDGAAVGCASGFLTGVAAAVRLLVLTTDVDRIVIGGGLAALGEPLIEGTHRILNQWAAESAFLESLDLADSRAGHTPRIPRGRRRCCAGWSRSMAEVVVVETGRGGFARRRRDRLADPVASPMRCSDSRRGRPRSRRIGPSPRGSHPTASTCAACAGSRSTSTSACRSGTPRATAR